MTIEKRGRWTIDWEDRTMCPGNGRDDPEFMFWHDGMTPGEVVTLIIDAFADGYMDGITESHGCENKGPL